ncbi:hypothetical protein KDN32_17730 [Nocardioides sp. J2M5]|uniref:hypothetical protein n=1 Tax=Nocardioides palaemonis TaxID=2829810 RepID=UPI001BA69EA3|nr:hypothetical protein [Nocardioides palaemonis]MBS2939583.1 hypothetical protein [Nocardioides palaemonis]
MTETMTFDVIPAGTVFSVDTEQRIIRGRAIPYGVVGTKNGRQFQFSKGTIRAKDGMKVKGWALHDQAHAYGVVTEWDDTDEGLDVAIKAAKTPEGDRALAQADSGVWDGFSIGPSEGAKYQLKGGVYHAVDIPIHEISLTPAPVFGGARVQSVSFDAINPGGSTVSDTTTAEAETTTEVATDFSAISDAITKGFEGLQFPQRETVSATAGGTGQVTEELPYRFDGVAGSHSFTQDIKDAYTSGDSEARQRIETFMDEAFAVTTGNVATLNPTQNRPELYVPNLSYTRPLYDLVSKGSIDDKTPFTVPRFSSAAGLVGDHAEGVEPTPGSFAATNQTISPAPVSGKIEINREVWDQGGSPQADGIIWGEMLNAYYEAVEAKIAARLKTTATAELNLAGAVDAPLVASLTNYFAGLQFVRGGNRFTAMAADAKLFPALVAAKDSAGRNLLPVLGPANAQGTVDGTFDRIQLGNQTVRAAWALAQGTNTMSFNFVPSSVWCWTSTPKRFTFEYQVKSIDMAIWGYVGTAILRDSDVKPIDYDTADA